MQRLLQTICYASTLIVTLIIGAALGVVCWQSKDYWQMTLGERPLPAATEFFQLHWRICSYLVMFPWLAFIGLPLVFPPKGEQFWDLQGFFLRLTTFILVEITIVLLILQSILAPATGILKALPPLPASPVDLSIQWLFWLSIMILVCFAAVRVWQGRRKPSIPSTMT